MFLKIRRIADTQVSVTISVLWVTLRSHRMPPIYVHGGSIAKVFVLTPPKQRRELP